MSISTWRGKPEQRFEGCIRVCQMDTGLRDISGGGKGMFKGTDVQRVGSVQEVAVAWHDCHGWVGGKVNGEAGGHEVDRPSGDAKEPGCFWKGSQVPQKGSLSRGMKGLNYSPKSKRPFKV